MFQKAAIAAAFRIIQLALCQFFDFCISQDECPDGVCDEVCQDLDSASEASPPVVMSPGITKVSSVNIKWELLGELAEATRVFIAALRAFLGLSAKVG